MTTASVSWIRPVPRATVEPAGRAGPPGPPPWPGRPQLPPLSLTTSRCSRKGPLVPGVSCTRPALGPAGHPTLRPGSHGSGNSGPSSQQPADGSPRHISPWRCRHTLEQGGRWQVTSGQVPANLAGVMTELLAPMWDTDKRARPGAQTGTQGAAGTAQCKAAGCSLAPTPVRHRATAGAPRPGRPQAKLPQFPQTREASRKRKSKDGLGCICGQCQMCSLCSHPMPRKPESCSALACLTGRRARTPGPPCGSHTKLASWPPG